ncbi:MAG TPA: hypothetical protein VMF61_09625, partial [Candidatus Acidoferrales bacterium]|nr:hypothetical protein [Candidatus Acidoferrales bacterium]
AVHSNYVSGATYVELSNGKSFGTPQEWSDAQPSGATYDYVGNVVGNGKAGIVEISQNSNDVYVQTSTGSAFNAPALWTSNFAGTFNEGGLFDGVADFTGSGKDDAIVWDPDYMNGEGSFLVGVSKGSSFNVEPWSYAGTCGCPTGTDAAYYADVTGSGKAALIYVDGGPPAAYTIWVAPSTGSAFGDFTEWGTQTSTLTPEWFADVTGSGKADAIAIDSNYNVWVATSNGKTFGSWKKWFTPSGAIAPQSGYPSGPVAIADVAGSGKAALVYQTYSSDGNRDGPVYVALSTGSKFSTATEWSSTSGLQIAYGGEDAEGESVIDVNDDKKADLILQVP